MIDDEDWAALNSEAVAAKEPEPDYAWPWWEQRRIYDGNLLCLQQQLWPPPRRLPLKISYSFAKMAVREEQGI